VARARATTRCARGVLLGFRQLRNMPEMVAKYVGGMQTLRDLPGTTDRPAYQPVAPALQRQALQLLAKDIFSVDSFSFRPEFLASLSPDYNEWERAKPVSIPSVVLQLQTQALDKLMSAGTAQRLLELPSYLSPAQRKGALSLDEVYATLQSSVWSELQSGREIDPMRRNLQREHLQRVVAILTKGGASCRPMRSAWCAGMRSSCRPSSRRRRRAARCRSNRGPMWPRA
jgi:hypothetical protein